ncbi:PAS domain S-box-containing protein [Lutibacter oricola]|uniref:histidine kinase n=1 Tax=Lutibacter oricola TaxID=762486 RepID=A0A1H2TLV3_9FLAO|nr:ATP-binding protein [Lutibacter oricola]SDW44675.1 PAS domain S-box-containing protein [Lutibacter oricola]
MGDKNNGISLDNSTFFKFRRLYILAFSLIAGIIIVAQILIQKHLNSQVNDSRIINIAGRQRMLSQKLVKESLFLLNSSSAEKLKSIEAIKSDSETFLNSHQNLQDEFNELGELTQNNPELKSLFQNIEIHHSKIIESCNSIVQLVGSNPSSTNDILLPYIQILKNAEKPFLNKMNEIVFKFDEVSKQKVKQLKRIEYILLIISLLILVFEILFLFKPISIHIKNVIGDLIQTKKETQKKAEKIEELYLAKDASMQELKGLNYALDNAALFISVAQDGSVVHISKKFKNLLGVDNLNSEKGQLEDVLLFEESENQTVGELLKGKRRSIWVGELQIITLKEEKLWLEMSVIPMNQLGGNQRALILCTDITKRKTSQNEINILNEERFAEQVNRQKIQASQIVEAQEEERKRIAKDIHDGIGQMLTALKFNIESINTENVENTALKVDRLKDLLGSLIKEVRAVTFNLTPPELIDYGIVPTIQKLAEKLAGFTGKQIFFENKTNFKGRFDSLVETNLYRVVQEAVNNALKYANSNYILVSISHSDQVLSIVIDDDGKGFDVDKLLAEKSEAGMGLFFMKERISYINGRIFINSSKNNGTRITININLDNS